MSLTWRFTLLLVIFTVVISAVGCSNILFFHLITSASHRIAIWPLTEKLADSGHNVTYIFPLTRRVGTHPKVEEIQPSKLVPLIDAYFGDFDINFRLNNTIELWLAKGLFKTPEFCEAFYDSPEIQEWLARPGLHYDLIFIDSGFGQCAYGLVHKFKAKHILFNPVTLGYLWDPFGLVPESSSVPEFTFHRDPATMATSLLSRTLSTISPLLFRAMFLYNMNKFEETAREKLRLGEEMPTFVDIEQETSLVLHNTYFIDEYPMALPPLFVSYSGLFCRKNETKKRKALSKNLTAFIDDSTADGFVYISFGSITNMSTMPETMKNEFFKAFDAFPNLKFLWRWGDGYNSSMKIPDNVYIQKWFPQLDVLAHPKIKAFVSQVGRSSSQEAVCSGVPVIAIPILGDQDFNAERLEYIGAAVILDIGSLSAEKLVQAIRQVVQTDIYQQRLKELSAMFRDRPLDSLENVHYWVEYVLRHNTSLLKPLAMNQTWWQRRLLDVYLVVLLIVLTLMGTLMLGAVLITKFVVLPGLSSVVNNNVGLKKIRKQGKIE